jgi:hypothetical protein
MVVNFRIKGGIKWSDGEPVTAKSRCTVLNWPPIRNRLGQYIVERTAEYAP